MEHKVLICIASGCKLAGGGFMRLPSRFNIAAGLSLAVFLGTALACDYTADRYQTSGPFPLNGQMWELLCGEGRLVLRNDPQVNEEGDEFDHAFSPVKQAFRQKSAIIFKTLKVLKKDTLPYREKIAEWKVLEIEYEAQRRHILPKGLTAGEEHTLPLWPMLVIGALLPAAQLILFLYRRPQLRRELRNPPTVAAWMLLLMSVGVVLTEVRSNYAGITWECAARPVPPMAPPDPSRKSQVWFARLGLMVCYGDLQFYKDTEPSYSSNGIAGYSRGSFLYFNITDRRGQPLTGLTHWSLPGVAYAAARPRLDIRGHISRGYQRLNIAPEYIAALFFVYPFFRMRAIFRARRARSRSLNNQCVACGYQLTGITSDVCPECGSGLPTSIHP